MWEYDLDSSSILWEHLMIRSVYMYMWYCAHDQTSIAKQFESASWSSDGDASVLLSKSLSRQPDFIGVGFCFGRGGVSFLALSQTCKLRFGQENAEVVNLRRTSGEVSSVKQDEGDEVRMCKICVALEDVTAGSECATRTRSTHVCRRFLSYGKDCGRPWTKLLVKHDWMMSRVRLLHLCPWLCACVRSCVCVHVRVRACAQGKECAGRCIPWDFDRFVAQKVR